MAGSHPHPHPYHHPDMPPLVAELLRRGERAGLSEDALCRHLGISHSRFSRWKTGVRVAPDPRIPSNRKFYANAADFLGKTFGEVMAEVLFADSKEKVKLEQWIFDSLAGKPGSVPMPQMSAASEKLLHSILLNIPGREEFLEVLHVSFKAYVLNVLLEDWFEQPSEAIGHYQRISQRTKVQPSAHNIAE